MSERVVIAAVAENLPAFEPPVGDQGFELPYERRLKVALDVDHSETLAQVYRRAVGQLAPRIVESDQFKGEPLDTVRWTWFFEPGEEMGIDTARKRWEMSEDLLTVRADHELRWNRPQSDIPYADLLRASDYGLLRGDPRRPYLVLLLPQGGEAFQMAWESITTLWSIIGHMLAAREIVNLARGWRRDRLLKDISGGTEVVERHAARWARHGGGPRDVLKTLEFQPWPVEELRMLLGLDTQDEAEKLLRSFGLRPNEQGLYEISKDQEAELLGLVAWETSYGDLSWSANSERAASRLATLLRTGELPPANFD